MAVREICANVCTCPSRVCATEARSYAGFPLIDKARSDVAMRTCCP